MQDGEFECFSRELARVIKLLDWTGGRGFGRGAIESDDYQCVRLHFRQFLRFQLDLHLSPFVPRPTQRATITVSLSERVPRYALALRALALRALPSSSDSGASLGFHLPGALRFTLVVQLLTLGYGQLHLNVPAFQVHLGGNQRQPFFPRFSQ